MKLSAKSFFMFFFCLTIFVAANKSEDKTATPEEVIKKVHKAAKLLKEKGKAGLEILRDNKSEFTWKDTYIFVINCKESVVLANPAFREREGGNIKKHLDYDGKLYGLELCEVAEKPGGGWIEYIWPKPGSTKRLRKVSYIYPVENSDYIVCAGIYNEEMTLDQLNKLSGNLHKR